MKTIQFTGTENQLINLKNAIDFTDNDMPQQTETRVYLVDLEKISEELNCQDSRKLTDEEFMTEAEKQGTVYTLQKFQIEFNYGDANTFTDVIRFISVPFNGE